MAWNLTDEAYLQTSSNLPVSGQKHGIKSSPDFDIFNVLYKLKEFKDEEKFCDFTICANGSEFHAHKAVVAAWSSRLASLLTHDEQATGVVLQFDNAKAVECCIEYMYTGVVSCDNSNISSLLELGRTLMIDSLVDVCESYMQKNVTLQNFVSKYFLSLKFNLKNLEQSIFDFIATNIASIIEQPALLNLQPADFKAFLSTGKMDDLNYEAKFSLIISWVGNSITVREKLLMYLFDRVKWTHTVNDLLIKISCTQNIFTTNEFCLFQLLHSLVTAVGHHLGPFITAYPRLFAIYSHMIEDLSHPEAFSLPGQYHIELEPIVVSLQFSKIAIQPLKEFKEIAVNTDFEYDLSAFQTMLIPTQNPEATMTGCDDVENEVKEVENEEISKDEITVFIEPSNVVSNTDSIPKETEVEVAQVNSKHRRKSLPRKLPRKNAKEPKERKPRKQRKQISKEKKSVVNIETNNDGHQDELNDQNPDNRVNEKDENEEFVIMTEVAESIELTKADGTEDIVNNIEGETPENKNDINSCENVSKSKIKLTFRKGKRACLNKSKLKSKVSVTQKLNRPPSDVQKSSRPRVHCTYENCDFSAKLPHVLDKHIERVHMINVNLFCWVCDYKAIEMRDLCFHLKDHFPKPPYMCDIEGCEVKLFRLSLFVRHHMSHLKERPYQCDVCMKSYSTYNQMTTHKKLHLGRQFECDVCYKKFTTKGVMTQHRAIHFDNKPYLCDLCGFSTKHQSHLISHRKVHTGEVKKCTFPNCNYTTPKAGHMTQHMNAHLNIRDHVCQVCGKSFVVRSKLLRHERIHLKEKLFKCKQCEYQTSRTDRMKLHIESHGIKLKKKNKNNMGTSYDYDSEPEIDYHQLYEKIQPGDDPGFPTQVTINSSNQMASLPFISISDIKPMDVISFAASSSMIMGSYNTTRLTMEQLNPNTVTCIEDIQAGATFPQNFERIHTTAFDQL
ncbi:hypothetical protein ACF0H5_019536 [Mactra antiquata]